MRTILALLLLCAAAPAFAATDTLVLPSSRLAALAHLPQGGTTELDAFPDGYGGTARVSLKRIEVYAPDARVVLVDATGEHELARSRRIHLVGTDASGTVRVALAFDPDFSNLVGTGSAARGAFAVSAERASAGLSLRARPAEDALPAGVVPQVIPGEDALDSGVVSPDTLALTRALTQAANGAASASLVPVTAVVAVDTDNELMSERFANNTTAATNWIADLFGAMNVMYQRDLDVTLRQGTTYLRTTTDPYTVTDTPAGQNNLNEFGSYWSAHYGSVSRDFAMLLSGKASSGNSSSGIAWVNAYCRTASSGGSYSVTQVFTNPQVAVGYSALVVGHELGHNFGAYHTHCTNATTGGAPTGSNTIDKCYSGESGCYSGTTSCPTTGPGAPAGTVMSYCNVRGCGSNGQNVLVFHPTQIVTLGALIAQNTPSCLALGSTGDLIFRNGFD